MAAALLALARPLAGGSAPAPRRAPRPSHAVAGWAVCLLALAPGLLIPLGSLGARLFVSPFPGGVGGSGLGRAEIERMQRETMQVGEEKTAERERVDLCNHAEGVLYDLNEWLKYNGELIPIRDRLGIVGMLKKLDGRIRAQDEGGVKSLLKKLDGASREYRKAG